MSVFVVVIGIVLLAIAIALGIFGVVVDLADRAEIGHDR